MGARIPQMLLMPVLMGGAALLLLTLVVLAHHLMHRRGVKRRDHDDILGRREAGYKTDPFSDTPVDQETEDDALECPERDAELVYGARRPQEDDEDGG